MSDYNSKYTGEQIDAGIEQANKVPNIESSIQTLQSNKANASDVIFIDRFDTETNTLYLLSQPKQV